MMTKRLLAAALGFILMVLAGAPVGTAQGSDFITLYLDPAATSVIVNQVFTVDIVADVGANTADTADAYIDFDPTYLEVVDESGTPATTIELSTNVFSSATFNSVDNTTGRINFSASKYDSPYLTGSFTAATIRFRANAVVDATNVTFARSGARWSDLYLAGESLNSTITGGNVTVICLDFVNPPPGVSVEEIQAVADRWRQAADLPYDLDGDRRVTIIDIMRVAAAWDSTCP